MNWNDKLENRVLTLWEERGEIEDMKLESAMTFSDVSTYPQQVIGYRAKIGQDDSIKNLLQKRIEPSA